MGRSHQGRGRGRGGGRGGRGHTRTSNVPQAPKNINEVYFDISSNRKACRYTENLRVLLQHILGSSDYGPHKEEIVDAIDHGATINLQPPVGIDI